MKRECGDGSVRKPQLPPQLYAASPLRNRPLGNREGARTGLRPASQETGRRIVKPSSVGGTEEGDVNVTDVATQTAAVPSASRVAPALAALILGLGLVFAAGFAWPSYLHNATHDTRHALGLPCH